MNIKISQTTKAQLASDEADHSFHDLSNVRSILELKSHWKNNICPGGSHPRTPPQDQKDKHIHGNWHLGANKFKPSSK